MQTTKPKTGCGCGGTSSGGCGCGGKSSGGCGCGGGCGCKPAKLPEAAPALCDPCETASFIRPRFFAGQLLTEDDLGALIDYTVAKNRFHNSRLFGAGIVCGLAVECGPCNGSQIIVQPGYALDCCGNDLVLTCKRTLDLVPMIRDLAARKELCTDPCPPPQKAEETKGKNDDKQEVLPLKKYCLYARYAERDDQPVATYPLGDNCDAATCEPTRVIEGIVFELRCPPPKKSKTVKDVMEDCAFWLDRENDLTGSAKALRVAAMALTIGTGRPTDDDHDLLRELAKHGPEALTSGLEGPAKYEATLMLSSRAAALVGRMKAGELTIKGLEVEKLEKDLKKMAETVSAAPEAAVHPLMIELGNAVPNYVELLGDKRHDVEAIDAIKAGPFGKTKVLDTFGDNLERIAELLQREAGCGKSRIHTDCTLPALIDTLTPKWNRRNLDSLQYEKAALQFQDAACAIERYLYDCWCAAINPPCPPCDDPGVLLACITVDACNVVQICNTDREYVLAPSTLRYWDMLPRPDTSKCCDHTCRHRKPGIIVDPVHGGTIEQPTLTLMPREVYPFLTRAMKNVAELQGMDAPSVPVAERAKIFAGAAPRSREAELIDELFKEVEALKAKIQKLEKKKGES
ncbi:MAG TPA: hypothetical protein VFV99_22750 [Kofleriaceae bacterium]|nr:hypothetical protein [Kofleriaceae bacterium]